MKLCVQQKNFKLWQVGLEIGSFSWIHNTFIFFFLPQLRESISHFLYLANSALIRSCCRCPSCFSICGFREGRKGFVRDGGTGEKPENTKNVADIDVRPRIWKPLKKLKASPRPPHPGKWVPSFELKCHCTQVSGLWNPATKKYCHKTIPSFMSPIVTNQWNRRIWIGAETDWAIDYWSVFACALSQMVTPTIIFCNLNKYMKQFGQMCLAI